MAFERKSAADLMNAEAIKQWANREHPLTKSVELINLLIASLKNFIKTGKSLEKIAQVTTLKENLEKIVQFLYSSANTKEDKIGKLNEVIKKFEATQKIIFGQKEPYQGLVSKIRTWSSGKESIAKIFMEFNQKQKNDLINNAKNLRLESVHYSPGKGG